MYCFDVEICYKSSSYDLRSQVRRSIAQWHYKALFDIPMSSQAELDPKAKREQHSLLGRSAPQVLISLLALVSTTMRAISDAVESLQFIAGLQSFFLIVNPNDPKDEGFLGGTLLGREFWRGHRGCGAPGAQAFKLFCQKSTSHIDNQQQTHVPSSVRQFLPELPAVAVQPTKKGTASALKSDVYASVRHAIRSGHSV